MPERSHPTPPAQVESEPTAGSSAASLGRRDLPMWARVYAGGRELVLLVALYVAYSLSRLLASNDMAAAVASAHGILRAEGWLHLSVEHGFNEFFVRHGALGLVADYWYCTAHYLVTPAILVWLYRKGPATYLPARRALVAATAVALALYIVLPTAPPRFLPGFVDVLQVHQHQGWWSGSASAPRGLGAMTNQLAAFPSMHCGYALWVAIMLHRHARSRVVRVLGWASAAMTAYAVLGTANHWVLDILVGWGIVVLACTWCRALEPVRPSSSAPGEGLVPSASPGHAGR